MTSQSGAAKMGDAVTARGDTFLVAVPQLTAGPHTIRLFWANASHVNVGDTAFIRVNVLR
jgi:hypothetical protein